MFKSPKGKMTLCDGFVGSWRNGAFGGARAVCPRLAKCIGIFLPRTGYRALPFG